MGRRISTGQALNYWSQNGHCGPAPCPWRRRHRHQGPGVQPLVHAAASTLSVAKSAIRDHL